MCSAAVFVYANAADHKKVPLRTRSRSNFWRCVTKLEKTSLSNDVKKRSEVETIICSAAVFSFNPIAAGLSYVPRLIVVLCCFGSKIPIFGLFEDNHETYKMYRSRKYP
jgi:hypothetical protein